MRFGMADSAIYPHSVNSRRGIKALQVVSSLITEFGSFGDHVNSLRRGICGP